MLSHENLVRANEAFTQVDPLYDSDNHVSLLPLGWIAEHAWGVAPHCIHGMVMNIRKRLTCRDCATEGTLQLPLWDALLGTIQVRMAESSWINRKLYEFFHVGRRNRKLAFARVAARLPYRRLVPLPSAAR